MFLIRAFYIESFYYSYNSDNTKFNYRLSNVRVKVMDQTNVFDHFLLLNLIGQFGSETIKVQP